MEEPQVTAEDKIEAEKNDREQSLEPLGVGEVLLEGRYRIVRLLHQRPRVNLYLAWRLGTTSERPQYSSKPETHETLVAIRELVLTDLPAVQALEVEQAAFEEFVSPVVFGSLRLPGAGDRVRSEGSRHYLVMQLRGEGSARERNALSLADLLHERKRWPGWLGQGLALNWGTQLARLVARLHRLGCVLGDLDPELILVDATGPANWAPVLLVGWPPPAYFWLTPRTTLEAIQERMGQLFPLAIPAATSPFVAPELLSGGGDERSDVYSLGALLYLLYTRYAPVTAARRLVVAQAEEQEASAERQDLASLKGLALIAPQELREQVPAPVESVLLRALALDPAERYQSVFELVEELEFLSERRDLATPARSGWQLPWRRAR